MKKFILTIILLTGLVFYSKSQEINVLFIGNSITASGLPQLFKDIAQSKGYIVNTEHYWSGQLLREYVQDQGTVDAVKAKFKEKKWDFVVLQENSAVGGFYPGNTEGYFEFYSYNAAKQLNALIKEANPCTETVFFMTYGYINGDQQNFPSDTYNKQQTRLRRNYKLLADSNSALLAPVGMTWNKIREEQTWGTDLYINPGDHHPSQSGSYLAGCVFFATIFNQTPLGAIASGIDPLRAEQIQLAAQSIVLDSTETWNIEMNKPNSDFTRIINHKTVDFKSLSLSKNVYHKWYFGDGDSSETTHPTHTYAVDGDYSVIHVVYSGCYPESRDTEEVKIETASISSKVNPRTSYYYNQESHLIEFINFPESAIQFQLFDIQGKERIKKDINSSDPKSIDLYFLPEGIYLIKIFGSGINETIKINR